MAATQHTLRTAATIARMEWRLEWRQGHQLAAVGLFAVASVYVAFQASDQRTSASAWTAMLWLVHLFSGFTAIGRLFDRERSQVRRYLQWTAAPLGLMLGKLFHAVITTTALTGIVLGAFVLFLGWPVGIESPGKAGPPHFGRLVGRAVHDHHLGLCIRCGLSGASGVLALWARFSGCLCSYPSSSSPPGSRAAPSVMSRGPCSWSILCFSEHLARGRPP